MLGPGDIAAARSGDQAADPERRADFRELAVAPAPADDPAEQVAGLVLAAPAEQPTALDVDKGELLALGVPMRPLAQRCFHIGYAGDIHRAVQNNVAIALG